MFGRKKQSISKKYILILIIILIILLLIIFSFTLKEDRKLSKAESLLKDGLIYSEKISNEFPRSTLARKACEYCIKVPVPQTDTGRWGEDPKMSERSIVKELGKLTK